MVNIKVYLRCSMIVGNFVDVYLLGILAVLMNWFIYGYAFGMLILPFLFYLFSVRYSSFPLIPGLPDVCLVQKLIGESNRVPFDLSEAESEASLFNDHSLSPWYKLILYQDR